MLVCMFILFVVCFFHVHVSRILSVASIINHFQVFVVYAMVIKILYLVPINRSDNYCCYYINATSYESLNVNLRLVLLTGVSK
jgi:hypothetical protein